MRLIFVPQYPSKLRYQEWWYIEFPKEFEKRGFEVVTLGKNYLGQARANPEMFSPINEAINFECEQIKEFTEMKLYNDDILFLSDISFPGLFPNILFHKRCKKNFAFCHATSVNTHDYYSSDVRPKFSIETSLATIFKKVFAGSFYHREKLINRAQEVGWHNVVVTRLPFPPFRASNVPRKFHYVSSASRPTRQKVNLDLEIEFEKMSGKKINRIKSNTWEEYYDRLAHSEYLLITSSEETFGYQVVDAIINNCIPIAPKAFSYPELLPESHLYPSRSAASKIIEVMDAANYIPELKCIREMELFYDKIVYEMRE